MNTYRRDKKYNMSWIDSMFKVNKTKSPIVKRIRPVVVEEVYEIPGMNYYSFSDDKLDKSQEKVKEKGKELKITISNSTNCYLTYKDHGEYYNINTKGQGHIADMYRGPTWNCQIQSIAGMESILRNYNTIQAIEILAHSWNNSNRKTELLVDIPKNCCEALELIFSDPTDILIKTPYINNTGSEMCIYLLQIRSVLKRLDMMVDEWQFDKELGRYVYV